MTSADTATDRTPTDPAPDPSPSRDDPGTTRCPVCLRCYTPVGRQLYCSTACRKTAFPPPPPATRPGRSPSRPTGPGPGDHPSTNAPTAATGTSESNGCESCGTFARRVGMGACPNCDGPVAISDLLDQAVVTIAKK